MHVFCIFFGKVFTSSWVPFSTTFPLSTTAIISALRIVDKRWATTIVVILKNLDEVAVESKWSSAFCDTNRAKYYVGNKIGYVGFAK